MPTPITPIIYTTVTLLIDLIKIGKEAKELNEREFDNIKARIDSEFNEIPRWEDL